MDDSDLQEILNDLPLPERLLVRSRERPKRKSKEKSMDLSPEGASEEWHGLSEGESSPRMDFPSPRGTLWSSSSPGSEGSDGRRHSVGSRSSWNQSGAGDDSGSTASRHYWGSTETGLNLLSRIKPGFQIRSDTGNPGDVRPKTHLTSSGSSTPRSGCHSLILEADGSVRNSGSSSSDRHGSRTDPLVKTHRSWTSGRGHSPRRPHLSTEDVLCKVKHLLGHVKGHSPVGLSSVDKATSCRSSSPDGGGSSVGGSPEVTPKKHQPLAGHHARDPPNPKTSKVAKHSTRGLANLKSKFKILEDLPKWMVKSTSKEQRPAASSGVKVLGLPGHTVPTAHVSPSRPSDNYTLDSSVDIRSGAIVGGLATDPRDYDQSRVGMVGEGGRWSPHDKSATSRGEFHALVPVLNATFDQTQFTQVGHDAGSRGNDSRGVPVRPGGYDVITEDGYRPLNENPREGGGNRLDGSGQYATPQDRGRFISSEHLGGKSRSIPRDLHLQADATANAGNAGYTYPSYQRERQATYAAGLDASRAQHPAYLNDRKSPLDTRYGLESREHIGTYGSNHVLSSTNGSEGGFDLTSWQQKHQEQLLRQQMDIMQPLYPDVGRRAGGGTVAHNLVRDMHKMDAVKMAADNIIREKDLVIERQKRKLLELESGKKMDREKEIGLHRVEDQDLLRNVELQHALGPLTLQDAVTNPHVMHQELRYENATLKAREAALRCGKQDPSEELERKLCAREYEFHQLKQKLDGQIQAKSEDLKRLEAKVSEKDALVLEWQDKHCEQQKNQEVLQRQLTSLQQYFKDLPTSTEHKRTEQQLRVVEEERDRHKKHVADLERKVADGLKGTRSRDGLIESLEAREKKQGEEILRLKDAVDRLETQLKAGGAPCEDMEELKEENQRLRSDCDKARKLMEVQHKKQLQLESRHKAALSAVEERLGQEEAAVVGLREEIAGKDQHLAKLRQSVKQLGAQNQDLMEKTLIQADRIRDLERQHCGEAERLQARLLKEIGCCFADLQSLFQLSSQMVKGQDPNVSILLGPKASTSEPSAGASSPTDNVQSLKYRVSQTKEMRGELEKLREMVAQSYAEHMGDNLNCTTQ